MLVVKIILWTSVFCIFYSFIGYPLSLLILNKIVKKREYSVNLEFRPTVSIIIPAHNEEKVIRRKLENLINLNYPNELLEIIIASDNSTDKTNKIVQDFIQEENLENIILYKVNKRQGKTNAQNEAVKIAQGDILVFSDANAILNNDSVIHLVSSFTEDDIIYVTGRLNYVNSLDNITSAAESNYWNYDLLMRKIESDIKTITAGNGAIYAIRKSEYIEVNPIHAHDAAIPLYAALKDKRAIYNANAIANEKAGQTSSDEFKRKVRMFRSILTYIFKPMKKYNIFKYGWFSYFYFGHRTLRLSLFIFHISSFIANLFLIGESKFYLILFVLQCLFYAIALIQKFFKFDSKLLYYPYYYSITLVAQFLGTFNQITGKSKPFLEKSESTR